MFYSDRKLVRNAFEKSSSAYLIPSRKDYGLHAYIPFVRLLFAHLPAKPKIQIEHYYVIFKIHRRITFYYLYLKSTPLLASLCVYEIIY